jgi:ornithine cyclodeaminase/alanine dehydrogenase-like protein (mu-crystallin family)
VLYDSAEGELKSIVIGEITCSELPENVAVTGLRTAASSAVGTDALARRDAERIGILGCGGQARNHLVAFCKIRRISEVKVYSRAAVNRERFAAELSPIIGCPIKAMESAQDTVRGVDIVLTATNSSVPVFDGNWLEPGVHVTSIVGSNVGLVKGGFTKAKRREIDDTTLARSDVIGIASVEQAIQDEQGDIFDPIEKGILRREQLVELGALVAGKTPGRTKPEQITLFKNNAGQGVADVALGALVLRMAVEKGLGQALRL